MKQPDEDPLLREILADEKLADLRRASLESGLGAMRQERRRRRLVRTGTVMLLPCMLVAAIVWLKSGVKPNTPAIADSNPATLAAGAPPTGSVQTLSDEDLFALFPGQPLALIGKPGQQELVFLDVPMRN